MNDGTVVYHGSVIDSKGTIEELDDNSYEMIIMYQGIGSVCYTVELQGGFLIVRDDDGNDLVFEKK